jgi:CubicO group peptidase (beta-lactamase class C family)
VSPTTNSMVRSSSRSGRGGRAQSDFPRRSTKRCQHDAPRATGQALAEMLRRPIQAGELAGSALLVWRDGHPLRVVTAGRCDLRTGAAIERTTIFRLASLTKPITTVAALRMPEEGLFGLDDPIARFAPEFSHMRVLRDAKGALDATEETRRRSVQIPRLSLRDRRPSLGFAPERRHFG